MSSQQNNSAGPATRSSDDERILPAQEVPEGELPDQKVPTRPGIRILQYAGAIIATAFALWFLFGIPAYLLFGIFFGDSQ